MNMSKSKPYKISEGRQICIAPLAFDNLGWIAGETVLIQYLDLENKTIILKPTNNSGEATDEK